MGDCVTSRRQCANEIPQTANRVVGGVRDSVRTSYCVVVDQLYLGNHFLERISRAEHSIHKSEVLRVERLRSGGD